MSQVYKIICVLSLSCFLFAPSVKAESFGHRPFSSPSDAKAVRLDLTKQEINGVHFSELTIDAVAKLLGRPSAVNNYELIKDVMGPVVYYHDAGLEFYFDTQAKNPQQKCYLVVVHFSKAWDKNFSEFFMPVSSPVVPSIDADKRLDDIKGIVGAGATIKTPDERRVEMESLGGLGASAPVYYYLTVGDARGKTIFMFDETTKFLEKASITKAEN